jgi:hypothetical protein
MSKDIASGFSKLNRPKSLVGAALRFLLVVLVSVALLFVAPNSWTGWQAGLIFGLISGVLWAVSWRWRGTENRVVAWFVIWTCGMALWGTLYRDIPSLGALACMYVGFEFLLLISHSHLKAWTARDPQK